jgi:hypothetical protein
MIESPFSSTFLPYPRRKRKKYAKIPVCKFDGAAFDGAASVWQI